MNLKFLTVFLINSFFIFSDDLDFKSSYQEFLIAQPTPEIQLNFAYNLEPTLTQTSIPGLATTVGGSVSQESGMAKLSVSSSSSAVAVLASKKRLSSQPGQAAFATFSTIFTSGGTGNNTQYVGIGNAQEGFFFGYTGTQFGILYRKDSVNSWTNQASWNKDTLLGSSGNAFTLIPGCGNVYKIEYQPIGFGPTNFYVQDPSTANWILVHTMQSLNSLDTPTLVNSSMQLLAVNNNLGTVGTTINMFVPCMAAFIQGKSALPNVYARYSRNFRDTSVSTSIRTSITFRNNLTIDGLANQTMVYVDSLSFSNTLASAVIISLFINPTLSGSITYAAVNTNSVVSAGTNSRTVTSGTPVMIFYLNNSVGTRGIYNIDLSDQNIVLAPGDVLSITTQSTAGTLNNVGIGISWIEKQ